MRKRHIFHSIFVFNQIKCPSSLISFCAHNTKAAIIKIYRDLQERDNYVTAETVRNVFLGATIKQQTLLQLCDKHNLERKPLIGVSICAWNYGSYCRMRNHLADFLHRWYNISDIPIRDVDYKFISNFEAYLTENYRYAHNTLTHYLQNLRHIIHLAIDAEYITKNPFANFKLQVKCPDRAYLTQEEVEKMIETHIKNEKVEQAKDIFLFCCFTGLSYSDIFTLTKQQIQQSFNGKLWIKGKWQKEAHICHDNCADKGRTHRNGIKNARTHEY